jgi:hypothetical protein
MPIKKKNGYSFNNMILFLNDKIKVINNSKVFAGLIVIILNIASRYVTIKLSKTMESYLRHTLSRDVLVFCIVWMGSREIYVALVFTIVFTFMMDYLLNEESEFCILPENFTNYHKALLDGNPTQEEITNAKHILQKINNVI